MATLSKTNSAVATNSCQDSTLLSDNDDSSESEQNSDTSDEKMDIDDGFLPGNDEDEHMDSVNFDKILDKMQQPGEPNTSMLNSFS